MTLTTLPADLRKWQGVEALTEYLPVVQGFLQRCPRARMVTILDPVAGALKLAEVLREHFLRSISERCSRIRRSAVPPPEATVQHRDGYDRDGD
jgi:hypothetical protein